MPSIVIRLDPAKLSDPDLDMRYEIPDLLAARSGGILADDGYDYEEGGDDEDGPALLIFIRASSLDAGLPHVLALLRTDRLHGNDLAAAAVVGVSAEEAADATTYEVVFPPGAKRVLTVRP